MGVLDEFSAALTDALTVYKAVKAENGEVISQQRSQDIETLERILIKTEDEISAVGMRAEIVAYLATIQSNWLSGFISLFDTSELKKLFNLVLEKYPESELANKEYLQLRRRQILIGTAEDGTNLLEKIERLSDAHEMQVKRVELAVNLNKNLTTACDELTERCQQLITQNKQLQQEMNELQERLAHQLQVLQKKIREQDDLIDELNHVNHSLRQDRDKLQRKFEGMKAKYDELTPKYDESLKIITLLKQKLRDQQVYEAEMQATEATSETQFSLSIN